MITIQPEDWSVFFRGAVALGFSSAVIWVRAFVQRFNRIEKDVIALSAKYDSLRDKIEHNNMLVQQQLKDIRKDQVNIQDDISRLLELALKHQNGERRTRRSDRVHRVNGDEDNE